MQGGQNELDALMARAALAKAPATPQPPPLPPAPAPGQPPVQPQPPPEAETASPQLNTGQLAQLLKKVRVRVLGTDAGCGQSYTAKLHSHWKSERKW